MRKIDEKCRKLTENVPKYAYKMLLEAADSETKKIVSELSISNHSFSKDVFRVRFESNYLRFDSIRIRMVHTSPDVVYRGAGASVRVGLGRGRVGVGGGPVIIHSQDTQEKTTNQIK